MSSENDLPRTLKKSWRGFIETYEPLRADLYRYCRHLTHSAWDAEDLAQDTLARAFVTLAQLDVPPENPRAWLFRVASNLWIDTVRKRRPTSAPEPELRVATAHDPRETREAAGTLLGQLSPQERAAVVLKDAFDLSLDETASALSTTVGAVKAALHRARGKLVDVEPDAASAPAPAVLDDFCAAFNAGDLERVTALLLDDACVEVVGATTLYGRESARRIVLNGMLFGVMRRLGGTPDASWPGARFFADIVASAPPRAELRAYRGRWLLLHWYEHTSGSAVRAITSLTPEDGHIVHVANYFYSPEFVRDVCDELGVPSRSNGHCW